MGVKELVALIRERRPCVALTGAGVSTESGIPDFRSAKGLWAQYEPWEVASIDGLRRDPGRAWGFYAKRLELLGEVEPNAAHHALAALERGGWVRAVITQNVDGLHQRAGSQDVVEAHGSIRTASCLTCGRQESIMRAVELLPVPRCARCGSVLKPDVVMFGELLQDATFERAAELARSAGVLLVVGSSLEVWPVAGLPAETLAGGGQLAIVNREPTPYDGDSAVVVTASAGAVLSDVAAALLA